MTVTHDRPDVRLTFKRNRGQKPWEQWDIVSKQIARGD